LSKRPEILNAAQELFGRHGLKKVTTDDIARDARVSKATIYKLYPNKQAILKAVVRQEMEELLTKIKAAVAEHDNVEDRMRAHLLTKINTVHQLINLHSVTRESMAEHWGIANGLREQFVREEAAILEDILRRGEEEQDLEVADPRATAHFMVVSLQSLEYPWAVEGLEMTVNDQVELMLQILLNGLRRRE